MKSVRSCTAIHCSTNNLNFSQCGMAVARLGNINQAYQSHSHQSLDHHYTMWCLSCDAQSYRLSCCCFPDIKDGPLPALSFLPTPIYCTLTGYSDACKYVCSASLHVCYHGHTCCLALLCVNRCKHFVRSFY